MDVSHNFDRESRIYSAADEAKSHNIHSNESATAYIIINGRIEDYNRANLQLALD